MGPVQRNRQAPGVTRLEPVNRGLVLKKGELYAPPLFWQREMAFSNQWGAVVVLTNKPVILSKFNFGNKQFPNIGRFVFNKLVYAFILNRKRV